MAAWLLVVSLLGLWAGADSHILQTWSMRTPWPSARLLACRVPRGEPEDIGEPWGVAAGGG